MRCTRVVLLVLVCASTATAQLTQVAPAADREGIAMARPPKVVRRFSNLAKASNVEIKDVRTTKWMNGAPMRQSTKNIEYEVTIANRNAIKMNLKLGRWTNRDQLETNVTMKPVELPPNGEIKVIVTDPADIGGAYWHEQWFALFPAKTTGNPFPWQTPISGASATTDVPVIAEKRVFVKPQCPKAPVPNLESSADPNSPQSGVLSVVNLVGGTGDATSAATSGKRLKYSDVTVYRKPGRGLEADCFVRFKLTNDTAWPTRGIGFSLVATDGRVGGSRPFNNQSTNNDLNPGESKTLAVPLFECQAGQFELNIVDKNNSVSGAIQPPTKAVNMTYAGCAPVITEPPVTPDWEAW